MKSLKSVMGVLCIFFGEHAKSIEIPTYYYLSSKWGLHHFTHFLFLSYIFLYYYVLFLSF